MDNRSLASNIFFNFKEVQNTTEKSFLNNTRLKNSLTCKIIFKTCMVKKKTPFFLFFMKNILDKSDERIITDT